MREERGVTVSPPQGRASRPKHVVRARAGGVRIKRLHAGLASPHLTSIMPSSEVDSEAEIQALEQSLRAKKKERKEAREAKAKAAKEEVRGRPPLCGCLVDQ